MIGPPRAAAHRVDAGSRSPPPSWPGSHRRISSCGRSSRPPNTRLTNAGSIRTWPASSPLSSALRPIPRWAPPPTHDTKRRHYRRIAYNNGHFAPASGLAGHKTGRGYGSIASALPKKSNRFAGTPPRTRIPASLRAVEAELHRRSWQQPHREIRRFRGQGKTADDRGLIRSAGWRPVRPGTGRVGPWPVLPLVLDAHHFKMEPVRRQQRCLVRRQVRPRLVRGVRYFRVEIE